MSSRNLHHTLIKNYVVFVLLMLFVAFLSALFLGLSISSIMSGEAAPKVTANDIARPDYENMDISDIQTMGGWVEILDEGNNVVFIKGDKKTTVGKYDSNQLFQLLSYTGKGQGYISTAKAIKVRDGSEYTCLVILPGDSADLQLNLIKAPLSVTRKFLSVIIIGIILFIVLFIINVIFYTKWTAKRIGKPLESITGAIHNLRSGRLDTRMEFKAENEFIQIRDAFNDMAEKLEQVQQEKSRLEEARNRMFIDISHDLKTPITVISGYSKALSEHMVKDETQKQRYIETIYNKSVRVSNMIENVFELAKLENGVGMNRENVDLAEFIRGIAAEYYEQIESKGLLLDLNITEEIILCYMDKKEMARVISNLLCNAIQYNPAGTTIKVELSSEKGNRIIKIADNGTGILENVRETLFNPFVRGDASRNSDGGTGLGLSIAKKIVENHGGSLKLITNQEPFKSIFIITLLDRG